jgi:hypothetical protein
MMSPPGSAATQVGATKEAAPEKEEETTWDIITSHRQTGALGMKES